MTLHDIISMTTMDFSASTLAAVLSLSHAVGLPSCAPCRGGCFSDVAVSGLWTVYANQSAGNGALRFA